MDVKVESESQHWVTCTTAQPTWPRSAEQVMQRLDRLIHKIYELQEPHIQGGGTADVLLVRSNMVLSLGLIPHAC